MELTLSLSGSKQNTHTHTHTCNCAVMNVVFNPRCEGYCSCLVCPSVARFFSWISMCGI